MAVPPVDAFTSVLQVLLTAALKDAIALVDCCPNLCRQDPDCNDMYTQLFNLARATRSFLQRTLIPALRGRAKRSLCQQSREGLVISLTSPLAGAIPAKFAERLRGDAPLH